MTLSKFLPTTTTIFRFKIFSKKKTKTKKSSRVRKFLHLQNKFSRFKNFVENNRDNENLYFPKTFEICFLLDIFWQIVFVGYFLTNIFLWIFFDHHFYEYFVTKFFMDIFYRPAPKPTFFLDNFWPRFCWIFFDQHFFMDIF